MIYENSFFGAEEKAEREHVFKVLFSQSCRNYAWPVEFVQFFEWVENNGCFGTSVDGAPFIAIGYDELCWPEDYDKSPKDLLDSGDGFHPATQLRKWLEKEFDVFISQITSEIVNQMSEIGEESTDPFCHWVGSINPL